MDTTGRSSIYWSPFSSWALYSVAQAYNIRSFNAAWFQLCISTWNTAPEASVAMTSTTICPSSMNSEDWIGLRSCTVTMGEDRWSTALRKSTRRST